MKRVREALVEVVIILFVGSLIGGVLAAVSNLFVMGVQYFTQQREMSEIFTFSIGSQSINYSSIVFLLVAATIVVFIRSSLGITNWSGPAESMYAAHQVQKPLNLKQGFGSTLAAFTSASGGASVGQYGPIVHFGATMGIWVKRFVSSRLTHDIYLGCGVAAAISAGFNAPIAGVVFAHEAILRHFSVRAIAPITVASVSASTLSNYWFPQGATFNIGSSIPSLSEVVPFLAALSPIFALVAITFMVSLRFAATRAKNSQLSPRALPFVAAIICGVVGIWVPEILGLGIASINEMIAGQFTLTLLMVVLITKILMTALCLGCGLFGGVFSPSLFIGVATGALAGQLLALFGFSGIAGVISVAARAAVSSAVIGAPISAVLIVLELTQSYQYAVAAMMSVMLCGLLTNRLFGHSYFDRQLLDRGICLQEGREALALSHQTVGKFAGNDFIRVSDNTSGEEALKVMKDLGHTEAYVLTDKGKLLGKVSIHGVIECRGAAVKEVLDSDPIVLYTDEPLDQAMKKVSQFVGESLPVVRRESSEMKGSITEGALFQAVIEIQTKSRNLERS
jgi:CIC family chloride channel protein